MGTSLREPSSPLEGPPNLSYPVGNEQVKSSSEREVRRSGSEVSDLGRFPARGLESRPFCSHSSRPFRGLSRRSVHSDDPRKRAHPAFGRSSVPVGWPSFSVLRWLGRVCLNSGCVYRRLIVRSDPPGARVLIDGQEVGYTPTGIPFTYYGTRRLTLVKPGFETHSELVTIPPPWYQWMPLDFVSDNFLPGARGRPARHQLATQPADRRSARPVAAAGRLAAFGSPHGPMTNVRRVSIARRFSRRDS